MNGEEEIVPSGKKFRLPQSGNQDNITPSGTKLVKPEPEGWISGGARTAASGLTEGTSALLGLPTTLWNAAGALDEKLGLGKAVGMEPVYAPDVTGILTKKASDVTGGYTDYTPETGIGRAAKNVASFAPTAAAAALTGGTSLAPTLLTGAVVPGVAGEVARTGGEKLGEMIGSEDPERIGRYAKLAAEITSPIAASKFKMLPSMGKSLQDPKLQTAVDELGQLEAFGVTPTAGAYRTSQEAARAAALKEMSIPRTAATISEQPAQFSAGILSDVGITDDVAKSMGYQSGLSPLNAGEVVNNAANQIGSSIGSTYGRIQRNQVPLPDWANIYSLAGKMPGFSRMQPGMTAGDWLHAVRKQAGEIQAGASKATLGKSYGPAAEQLIKAVDDAVLKAIGPDEFAKLQAANAQFSRLSTVRDAFDRASSAGRAGIVTPQDILAAGGTRHTEDMTDIAKIADKYLLSKGMALTPGNRKTAMKYFVDALGSAAMGGMSALAYGVSAPAMAKAALAATAGGIGTHALQKAVEAVKGSPFGQSVAKSHALYGTPVIPGVVAPAAGYANDTRDGRKRGGRVSKHEADADQLVRAAERAKKGWSAQTEPLLNQSDDAVAHALEVANRSI